MRNARIIVEASFGQIINAVDMLTGWLTVNECSMLDAEVLRKCAQHIEDLHKEFASGKEEKQEELLQVNL